MLAAAAPASAQPTVAVIGSCGYSGAKLALSGSGFAHNQLVTVEVMSAADPAAGAPLSGRAMKTGPTGGLDMLLGMPATEGMRPVARSVRVRPFPELSLGIPTLLANAPLTTANRGVSVLPQAASGRVGASELWRVTGLPEGTRLWAHYRHDRRTVKRVSLGTAKDPCGRLKFSLRTLPRGHERRGAWDVWMTTKRTFRVPRKGVYVQRRMTVAGSGPKARATFEPLRSRLVPSDVRAVTPETTLVRAYATKIGVIRTLFLGDARGAPVDFFERIGDRLKPLGRIQGKPGEPTTLEDATTWSCSRRTRRFVATTTLPDGSVRSGHDTIRTPSCASRFRLSVPRRVAPGGEIAVRVVDRWGNGAIKPTLCVAAPEQDADCGQLAFPSAVTIARKSFRASERGVWHVELRVRSSHVRRSVAVGDQAGVRKPAPTVLATGDSMMQGIDSFLADELADTAQVRRDVRPATGISRPASDWTQIAAEQSASRRTKNTAILIGAADGFPMTTPARVKDNCCGEPWIAEYARRARVMMQAYTRQGRLFWATLPLPKTMARLQISQAVNSAIMRAAKGMPGVTIVRFDLLFTPTGYSDFIRYRGRIELVREVDGVHLNLRGQAIAAKVFARIIGRGR